MGNHPAHAQVLICTTCFALTLFGTACSKTSNSASSPKPLELVAIDRSGSTEIFRKEQNAFIGEALSNAQNRGSSVGIWAVDREAVPIFDVKPVTSGTAVTDKLLDELKTRAGKNGRGTRPALFWEAMAKKYGGEHPQSANQPVAIVYLTDGDNDWAADAPRIRTAIQTLAKNQATRVAIVGVSNSSKEFLEQQLSPFGERGLLRGRDTQVEEISKWRNGEH